MRKTNKFIKSFLFITIWLIFSSYLESKYWDTFHWKYIYLNIRGIFDKEFWFIIEKYFFGIDVGYYLEELTNFITYEIPEESFKYIPIYVVLRSIWIKK